MIHLIINYLFNCCAIPVVGPTTLNADLSPKERNDLSNKIKFEHITHLEKYRNDPKTSERTSASPSPSIKESIIVFNTNLHPYSVPDNT